MPSRHGKGNLFLATSKPSEEIQSVKRFILFYRRLARLEYAPSSAVATAASATGGPGRAWTTAGSPIGHSAQDPSRGAASRRVSSVQ
jgi:hypothetical protein